MAWRCSGKTNAALIDNLQASGLINSQRIYEAFLSVDRAHFAPEQPYMDSPQSIGYGATISAPHMHAHAIENLEPFLKPGAKVLDVGCGSGYLLPILHHLVSPSGFVLGIDHLPQLTSLSQSNLGKSSTSSAALASNQVKIITGDGRKGAPVDLLPEGGFDAIHVGAASPDWPAALIKQLRAPGRMFVPVGELEQEVIQIDKDEKGGVTSQKLFGVRYVPLTDKEKQWK